MKVKELFKTDGDEMSLIQVIADRAVAILFIGLILALPFFLVLHLLGHTGTTGCCGAKVTASRCDGHSNAQQPRDEEDRE